MYVSATAFILERSGPFCEDRHNYVHCSAVARACRGVEDASVAAVLGYFAFTDSVCARVRVRVRVRVCVCVCVCVRASFVCVCLCVCVPIHAVYTCT